MQRRARPRKQQHGHRNLRHYQKGMGTRSTGVSGSTARLKMTRQAVVASRQTPRRQDPREEARENGHGARENQDFDIHPNREFARYQILWHPAQNRVEKDITKCYPRYAAKN